MANSIRPQIDGPLLVEGDVEVFAADGSLVRKAAKMWLCRCGQSADKPFCDGAHNGVEFGDAARVSVAYVIRRPEAGTPTASLRLTLRNDGPINCFGQARIVGADGSVWVGSQANLCRCGKSENKPFCDGSHRTAKSVER